MIKNSVILIPNQEEKNEICDFLSQTATILARSNQVFIIQLQQSKSIKEILPNILSRKDHFRLINEVNGIKYLSPIFLIPLRRINFISKINLKIFLLFVQLFIKLYYINRQKIIWAFFPHIQELYSLFDKRWFLVYDIVDFYTLPSNKQNDLLNNKKIKLLERSDLVTAISHSLKKQYQQFTDKKITVVPQGFKIIKENQDKTKNLRTNKKPIIGYIGHINNRFNFFLLNEVVSNNPQWNFILIGPKHHDDNISSKRKEKDINYLFSLKNVTWIKEQPKSKIFSYIQQFDICIIPYDTSYDFNKFSYPMKLFEYFYAKKPVISTPIQELLLPKFKDIILIGKNAKEWENNIQSILDNGWDHKQSRKQKIMSLQNSWSHKIKKISKLINKQIS